MRIDRVIVARDWFSDFIRPRLTEVASSFNVLTSVGIGVKISVVFNVSSEVADDFFAHQIPLEQVLN